MSRTFTYLGIKLNEKPIGTDIWNVLLAVLSCSLLVKFLSQERLGWLPTNCSAVETGFITSIANIPESLTF